ncbi:hypothetical protein [Oceanotoga sp.]|uniref:hypothetical protein n=1 Tax=Oceanotoga sp. TaxID=2108366 RepID=UPI0028043C51|nr:hypothetical protein [Oceanotoga sp.]
MYNVYKYTDIIMPPNGDSKILKIKYENDDFILKFEDKIINSNYEELDENLAKLIKKIPRSIFLISDNSYIITDNATLTSDFFIWNKSIDIKLLKDEILYDYSYTPVMGERISHIPNKFIKLNVEGGDERVSINGVEIKTPKTLEVPPSIINITNGLEEFSLDLKNYKNDVYDLNLKRSNLIKKINTKISKVFEIESGIFLQGNPYSIWINKYNIFEEKSRFFCDYGNVEDKNLKGDIVYVTERDGSVYIISSYGQLLTMGRKSIFTDFGRAPMSIIENQDYLLIKTFKLENYRINFNGGVFKEGNAYSVNMDIKNFDLKKDYSFENYEIEIIKDVVYIYSKEN